MRSSITLGFLANGVPVTPNRQVNVTEDHPDLTDAVGLDDLIATGTAIYLAVKGQFKLAGATILPELKKAYDGKDLLVQREAHETLPQGGQFRNISKVVDEVRIVFRAESEDSLTESFGRVDQSEDLQKSQVNDIGERRFSQGDTNVYVRRFAIPLLSITPGDYVFNFGSGDDGWFFDVGVNSILTVSISISGPPAVRIHPPQGPVLRRS